MYRGGLPPVMMSGRYFSASSSHVVTCARMSFTDQFPMTPGSVSCESDKPAYDSLIAVHAFSSCFRSCCLSMIQFLPPPLSLFFLDLSIVLQATRGYLILALKLPSAICAKPITRGEERYFFNSSATQAANKTYML